MVFHGKAGRVEEEDINQCIPAFAQQGTGDAVGRIVFPGMGGPVVKVGVIGGTVRAFELILRAEGLVFIRAGSQKKQTGPSEKTLQE